MQKYIELLSNRLKYIDLITEDDTYIFEVMIPPLSIFITYHHPISVNTY